MGLPKGSSHLARCAEVCHNPFPAKLFNEGVFGSINLFQAASSAP